MLSPLTFKLISCALSMLLVVNFVQWEICIPGIAERYWVVAFRVMQLCELLLAFYMVYHALK